MSASQICMELAQNCELLGFDISGAIKTSGSVAEM
jgi:hypothetical protein